MAFVALLIILLFCEDINSQALRHAKKINQRGTVLYLLVNALFSMVFWFVAFAEFLKPASEYMDRKID